MIIEQCVYDTLFKRVMGLSPESKIRKDGDFYLGTSATMDEIISLNGMAGEICLSCNGLNTVGRIFSTFKANFSDIDDNVLMFDICRCIADLERLGILQIIEAGGD